MCNCSNCKSCKKEDILRHRIESDESFSFKFNNFMFMGKDDNEYGLYYLAEYQIWSKDDYSMHFFREYESLKYYISQYFKYEHCIEAYKNTLN